MKINKTFKKVLKKVVNKEILDYMVKISNVLTLSNIRELIELKLLMWKGMIGKNVTERRKPHVLFVTEKWCDCNPSLGTTYNAHGLFGSLEASGLATQDKFHPDEYRLQNGRPFDIALLLKCMKSKPDLIILTWPGTPELKTLEIIKERIQIPMVALWWDSVNHMEEAESFLPFVELNVVVDSATAYLQKTHQPEKYMPMWTPWDSRIFYNPNLNRDIEVCFVGTMANHPDRVAGISALKANGVNVCQTGGQRECRVPVDEYTRIYMRSKIALNFCYHSNLIAQCKGRVFEATLCGAMLMEAENSETARWFEPMVDYVPFTNETDLIEKVKYYLSHDSERMEIAGRGHHKAKERYTGEIFWKNVFRKIFSEKF